MRFLIFELSRLFIKNSPEENHRNGLAVRLVLRHSLHLGVVEERREDLVFGTFVRAALLSRRRSFRRFFFFSSLFSSSFIKSRRSLSLVLSIVAGRDEMNQSFLCLCTDKPYTQNNRA